MAYYLNQWWHSVAVYKCVTRWVNRTSIMCIRINEYIGWTTNQFVNMGLIHGLWHSIRRLRMINCRKVLHDKINICLHPDIFKIREISKCYEIFWDVISQFLNVRQRYETELEIIRFIVGAKSLYDPIIKPNKHYNLSLTKHPNKI